MFKKVLFLLSLSMFLSACTIMQPSTKQPALVTDGAHRQAQVNTKDNNETALEKRKQRHYSQITANLLRSGQQALANNYLLTPEENNANLYFQAVLGRDPGNYQATMGIAEIVDRYLGWAVRAAEQHDSRSAMGYIANARLVNASDPTIAEVEQRVAQLLSARQGNMGKDKQKGATKLVIDENSFVLPADLFNLPEAQILEQIQPIINRVKETHGAIEIYWPRDKEGRLLYQIINSRISEFRVRAMTYQSSKHMIEVNIN